MPSYDLNKRCEVCDKVIPDDFGNLLCVACYESSVKENEAAKKRAEDERKLEDQQEKPEPLDKGVTRAQKQANTTNLMKEYRNARAEGKIQVEEGEAGEPHTQEKDSSVTKEGYKENPEAPDKPQVMANLTQFVNSQDLLYGPTKSMYHTVKNYLIQKTQTHAQFSKHIWKPHVVDVGSGCGVGANILSWEAEFVWGIDKNWLSTRFAQEAFTREKNGIYYSSQVTFDQLDIMKDNREYMQFDVVVAIEIIEHINDWRGFLKKIITSFSRKDKRGNYITGSEGSYYKGTEFFISTPNRNHPKISDESPKNIFHVREWTAQEFKAALSEYFNEVELLDYFGKPIPDDATHSPILAKCRNPK